MSKRVIAWVLTFLSAAAWLLPSARATSLMENLGRGVVAVRTSNTDVYVSWRLLGTDASGVGFNLYRSTGGGAAVMVNPSLITGATIFTDTGADLTQTNAYFVKPVIASVEQAASASYTLAANAPVQQYLRVPLQRPAGGTTPDSVAYTYSPNDCSVGDLDGDGEYEIIVKWDPSNSKDNSQSGYTGNVYLDAYKLDGTQLWRIDLGRNIRAGAHYTQFLVYDFDGDGKAEVVCKTAPNTKDGTGTFIGSHFLGTPSATIDHNADYRNSSGYILTGPEFFTVFNGQTGAELMTTNYVVPRNSNPASGDVTAWGDDYGNRVDRFLACVAYLDGQRPSFVLCRGYYTRAVLAAWDWRGGQLVQRWTADTGNTGAVTPLANWRGQGAHSLTVGDVDGDGRDEITYGAAAFDDDGTGLYSTVLGHGDALHMAKMDPNRSGLQVWMVHEDPGSYGATGLEYRDAKTGQLIAGFSGQGADVGRGVAGDIDPRYLGYEMWGARGGLLTANGTTIQSTHPNQMNFMVWWDGDLLREILDGTTIYKWDWNTSTVSTLLAPTGISSNNSTKATPNLSADIFGDWREEVIWREDTNDALRIYTTTIPTTTRLPTLMHDRQYRLAIAWQNVGYNQPPHPSFYLGDGMTTPAAPDIVTSAASLPAITPAVTSINRYDPASTSTGATSVVFRVTFNTSVTGVDATDFTLTNTGTAAGTVSGVSALSGYAYNVTVSSITGTGTIRLDLKSSGTGITGPGSVAISGGYTAGQLYNRATLTWLTAATGGLWSNTANWDGGVIADAIGATPNFSTLDITANNTVTLDSPRTTSGATFGDTATATAASWTIDDGGNSANVLTLDVLSGNPTVTVNALGTGAVATIAASLAGTDGLAKAGAGTLVLTKPNTLTGGLNVTNGTLRLDAGSTLALGGSNTVNVSTTAGVTLHVNGGSFSANGLATLGGGNTIPGTFRIDSGDAAFNGGIRTNNDFSSTIRVTGGTFTATDINLRRTSGASPDYTSGFIVQGGNATVGTIQLGTGNSSGAMSVEGGTLTATGMVTIGNQTSGGRGGGMRVTGGTFISTHTANGVVLARTNTGNANNVASATFTGGTSFIEKLTLGYDATVTAGSATVTLNGGTLYLGSGGIVKNGTAGLVSSLAFSSGTLGAKADWSTTHPITVSGDTTFKAANATDDPFNITLTGLVSGAGGLIKTGGGMLTLGGSTPHTISGLTTINGGKLLITGGLVASANGIVVNSGGTIASNTALNRAITLNSGGTAAPEGASAIATLSAPSLTWNGGGAIACDLGATGTSDQVALTGALTKGSAGTYTFVFTAGTGFAAGNTYTLATFGSTTFTASDFAASGLPAGTGALFTVNATSIQIRIQASATLSSGSIAVGSLNVPFTYTATLADLPATMTATAIPPGLSFNATTGVLSGTPIVPGTFYMNVLGTNTAGTVTSVLTVMVAKDGATIALADLSAVYNGAPHAARAITSPAGLATLVTYDGSITPPTAPGSYSVTARILDDRYSGTATGTLVISKAVQTINVGKTTRDAEVNASVTLDATSSSGLGVTYTLVSGPATLNGNVLTFTGTGTVVVRVSQSGTGLYGAATDETITFNVTSRGKAVFFGKIGSDDFAAAISADGTTGTLVTYLSGTNEALVLDFVVAPDGTFTAKAKSTVAPASVPLGLGQAYRLQAAAADRTFTGTIINGVLTGSIAELGTTFTATADPSIGNTTTYAGMYTGSVLGSASGNTYVIVGNTGQAYALVVTANTVSGATGIVTNTGAISVSNNGAALISGAVDATAAAINGTVTTSNGPTTFGGIAPTATATDRLINLSSRLRVTGNDAAHISIVGFVIGGSTAKDVLIRAVGPSLSKFGIKDGLADPQLRLFTGSSLIASNNGWNNDATIGAAGDAVGAFSLVSGSKDSAIVATLAPGAYTAQILSNNTGVALMEIYDVGANDAVPTKQLINISTRGYAGTGDDVLVAGFVVAGNTPKRVLIRGVGPGLVSYGVGGTLSDPVLKVYDAARTVIAQNDDWGTPQPLTATQSAATAADVVAATFASGAFPLTTGSKDAAVIITLNPGSYSAVTSGAQNGTGAAMIEVYELPKQ